MGYRIMGRAHAAGLWARGRLAGAAGQGTVEYVALILLVAGCSRPSCSRRAA